MFVYATSGHRDPLLYAQCNVDIFTKASDGVSPGDVRWVCHVHNSWENVAAGSTGNAGNPGPAGFANDPQSISYRAEIDDGASDVLDWSGLDATVTSASNPMQPSASVGCQNGTGTFCMNVPSSTGTNQWYYGQATRATCSGTCVGGVTNGQLYYAYPSGSAGGDFTTTQYVSLMLSPFDSTGANYFMTGSQGTGTTSFSTRFQHYHWSTWQTLDASGQDNWSPVGTTTRVTHKVYPAFTAVEKLYWQQTGLIIPLNLSQPTAGFTPQPHQAAGQYYEPFGRLNVIGFQGGGDRPDLGISNEWAAQAFINGTEQNWDYARLFTLGTSTQGQATILNEATGRIPPLNNGPPTGPGGNGQGGSYAGLGAPQPQVTLNSGGSCRTYLTGLADVPHDQPNATYPADLSQWGCGTYISHMPSFNGFTYPIFGSRHFLDVMQWHGNQDFAQQRTGPGPVLAQGYYRDNNATFPGDGHIYHYYGLMIDCCQSRGSAWLIRDLTYPATYGSDSDSERSYFNDFLVENRNYYPLWLTFKDGPGNTNYTTSITPPDALGADTTIEPFIADYVLEAAWQMVTFVHEPLGSRWMSKFQRYWEGVLGGQLPGAPVSYYAIDYFALAAFFNGDGNNPLTTGQGGNLGQYTNAVDAADWGSQIPPYFNILTGGQIQQRGGSRVLTVGDKMKNFTVWYDSAPIDQLSGLRFYTVTGPIDNNAGTFYLQCNAADHIAFPSQCPTAGAAFTGFTRGGAPVVNEIGTALENPLWRLQFDPGPCQGYANPNYVKYGGNAINALNILGYNVTHALADFNARCGSQYYNNALASFNWDPTVVIPGLPTPQNGL
jgi:hypothetical protein